jgi:hypothetical protein
MVIIQPLLFIRNTNDDPLTGMAYPDLMIAKVEIERIQKTHKPFIMSTNGLRVSGIGVEPI